MSGIELLSAFRTTGKNREVPVIVVTVVADGSLLDNFEVHAVLHKPIEPEHLLSALKDAGLARVAE